MVEKMNITPSKLTNILDHIPARVRLINALLSNGGAQHAKSAIIPAGMRP